MAGAPAPTTPDAAPAASASVVLLARQPILDAGGTVHGNELLFRRADGTGWPIEDESAATAQVLVAAFGDVGLGSVTGGVRAWINVPRDFLLTTDLTVLPPERVVLELLERNEVDDVYVGRAAELAAAGYTIALDDFSWDDDVARLLPYATYVKLDVRALGLDGIEEHVRRLATHGVRLVAEKVETGIERDACRALGMDLFQGYFFERPSLVRGRPAPHGAVRRLQAVTGLRTDASFEDVERVVRLDTGLAVRLLRYVNSAALALRHRVSSLRHALMLVGATTVRQWLLLVLLGDLGRTRPAVLTTALVRARLCEGLAADAGLRAGDTAFTVGLLSVCDALLDMPLAEVIGELPLTPELRDAIVHRQGRLGELLRTAVAIEHGQVPAAGRHATRLREALAWADEQVAEIA